MAKTLKWGLPSAVVLALFAGLCFWPVNAATVRLPRENNRLFGLVRTAAGADIRLRYRHSVEKTMVEGRFTIAPGPVLQAVETWMASVGTGLPNTQSARTRREGEWIVVDEGLQPIPGFDFFLSAINKTQVTVDGAAVPVAALAPGSVIHLDVEYVHLGQWVFWKYFNIDWRKDRK